MLWLAMPSWAHGQEADTIGLGILADSSYSGYEDPGGISGPEGIGAQLQIGNQVAEPYFRIPVRVFSPWYEAKARVNESLGLRYGINYTAVYLTASDGITDESETSSASGIIDIPVSWTLVGRESGDAGTLGLKFENRHVYGSNSVAPMFLGFQTGSILLPATKANEFTFRFTEFWWQQALLQQRLHVVVGKVDPTNYYTFHGLIHPFMNFFGYGSSVSPSANWPNQGFGVIASGLPTKNLYVTAGLHDAGGDPFKRGEVFYVGDNFFDGKFFKTIEVGYVPSFAERYFRKLSVTYWHSDTFEGSEEGQGVAFASHWFFQERYIPFLLAGFVLAKQIVAGGIGFRFKSHDILGLTMNWTNPPDSNLRDQYTAEAYYRFYLTEHLEITPDLQWVYHPSLNPNVTSLVYFGLRMRATL
jgi:porin